MIDDKDDDSVVDKNSKWTYRNNRYTLAGTPCDKLPAGAFKCFVTRDGNRIFERKKIETDELIVIEDSTSEDIVGEIKDFWKKGSDFKKYGFLHKRGFLLSGPPGGGKTATINLVVKAVTEDYDGVIVYIDNPATIIQCVQDFRKIEPDRPLVAVMEDIDDLIDTYGETLFLALLDGEHQINNIVFIATTNNPDKLQDRVRKRPSRFDTVVYIPMPCEETRRQFIQQKDPDLPQDQVELWVRKSEGLSIAHLKELIIMVQCFDKDLDEVIERMKNFDIADEEQKYQDSKRPSIGFNASV